MPIRYHEGPVKLFDLSFDSGRKIHFRRYAGTGRRLPRTGLGKRVKCLFVRNGAGVTGKAMKNAFESYGGFKILGQKENPFLCKRLLQPKTGC